MTALGVHLTLMIGREVPTPTLAPVALVEALQSVEVTQTDDGPSGFQITFQIGRSSAVDLSDFRLLRNPLLKPFSRVVLIVRFAVRPQVLMDGIITNIQLSPSNEPGQSTLTVTGEDISLLMDLEEKVQSYSPSTSKAAIVQQILGGYGTYITYTESPDITGASNQGNKAEYNQIVTDRACLNQLAQSLGFVFFVSPDPNAPLKSKAYFGPRVRDGESRPALSYNMGPNSNVDSINFQYNGLQPIGSKSTTER